MIDRTSLHSASGPPAFIATFAIITLLTAWTLPGYAAVTLNSGFATSAYDIGCSPDCVQQPDSWTLDQQYEYADLRTTASGCQHPGSGTSLCVPGWAFLSWNVSGGHISAVGGSSQSCNNVVCGPGFVYGRGHCEFSLTFTTDVTYTYTSSLSGNASGFPTGSGFISPGTYTISGNSFGASGGFSIDISLVPCPNVPSGCEKPIALLFTSPTLDPTIDLATLNAAKADLEAHGWDAQVRNIVDYNALLDEINRTPCVRGLYFEGHGIEPASGQTWLNTIPAIRVRDVTRFPGVRDVSAEDLAADLGPGRLDFLTVLACYQLQSRWVQYFPTATVFTPDVPFSDGSTTVIRNYLGQVKRKNGTPQWACAPQTPPMIEGGTSLSNSFATNCPSLPVCRGDLCGSELYPVFSCGDTIGAATGGTLVLASPEGSFNLVVYVDPSITQPIGVGASYLVSVPPGLVLPRGRALGRYLFYDVILDSIGTPVDRIQVTLQYTNDDIIRANLADERQLYVAWLPSGVAQNYQDIPAEVDTVSNTIRCTVPRDGVIGVYSLTCGPPYVSDCSPLPCGRVDWWPANGTPADSLCVRDLVPVNGTAYGTSPSGLAFSFDGVDDALDGGVQALVGSGTAPFTLFMRINLARLLDPNYRYTFLAALRQESQFWMALEDLQGNGLRILTTFRGYSGTWGHHVSLPAVIVGAWGNIAAVYTGGDKNLQSSYSVYINGEHLPVTNGDFWHVGGSVNNNWFGNDPHDGHGLLEGRIDDLQLFDRALTQEEIRLLGTPTLGVLPSSVGNEPPLAIAASPNPARGAVRIDWSGEATESVDTEIFDTQGRLVIRHAASRKGAGRDGSWVWDLRTSGGELAPAGVYVIRARDRAGHCATQRLLVVR